MVIRVNLFEINLAVGILRDPSQGKIVWIILTIVKENKVIATTLVKELN